MKQFAGWQDKVLDLTKEVVGTGRIRFGANDKFFEIMVGLNDFFQSQEHLYEYRFTDLDSGWDKMNRNSLRINSLPYGRHTLEIRGRNTSGELATNTVMLSVVALRPFYLTWWFLALMAVGVFLIFREYLLSRTRRIAKLEEMVTVRTQEIHEQAEALRQSQAARSRFFANISHELRTPLTLIMAPVKSAMHDIQTSERLKQYLRIIENNANTLRDRIDDLLALAQADAGNIKVNHDHVHLNALLERLMDSFNGFAKERHISLKLNNTLPASQVVQLDGRKLEQVLSNFLSNALKYSGTGTSVTLSCRQDKAILMFAVKDSGPGIQADELEKIFDRFYQVDGTSEVSGGVGLGLALSRELALAMGGTVWAESDSMHGSTFFLSLPYIAGVEDDIEAVNPTEAVFEERTVPSAAAGDAYTPRVLLVEDNHAMREFLTADLKQFEIESCSNGREALDVLARMKKNSSLPDLILSDVMMPVMDGFEMLRALKADPRLAAIPVIMLTARAGLEDKLEGLRIGVDDYIAKPFDMQELKVRIHNLLRKHMAARVDPDTDKSEAFDQQWLKTVEQNILKNIGDSHFTISRLASDMHISERQFQRRIKSYTGLTANLYIREVRLYEAKRLLESRVVTTVAELAYKVGFEGPDYFSRLYLERFGHRPSAHL
jgi:signal transduction histidine kinase/DNA-binding response OmpR family regulator